MASYALPDFLRVSIGTEAENDRFLSALRQVLSA
jgi:histidinol-phosphate aminotransferase